MNGAAAAVNKDLCLDLAHRPIQRVTRDCTESVQEFMDSFAASTGRTGRAHSGTYS